MQNSQYNKRIEDNKHTIESLNNYMLNNKNIFSFTSNCVNNIEKIKKKKVDFKPSNKIQSLFFPYQEDKLFWLYYIILNGIDNYKMLGENTYSIENKEKMNIIQTLKNNKSIIKELKTKIIDCENDLINSSKISLSTFNVLCKIKNINVLIIFKNIYFISDPDEIPNYFLHKVNNVFGYEPYNENLYEAYKLNKYQIFNITKPINGLSTYKVDELKKISELLHISLKDDNQKDKTKNILYDEIKNIIFNNLE